MPGTGEARFGGGPDHAPRRTIGAAGVRHRSIVDDVLGFWFGQDVASGYCEFRPVWFEANDAFDAEIRRRFLAVYERAAQGDLDGMARAAQGSLALVIVLDQFPRNLFRGDARAYATDGKARAVARRAIDHGFAEPLNTLQRMFLYMPFQHSEALEDQRFSVTLCESLGADPVSEWARTVAASHRDIIERFGRFPHRNRVLGRESTPEEAEFLDSPDGAWWLA